MIPSEQLAAVLARLPGMWVIEYRFATEDQWMPNPDRGTVITPNDPDELRVEVEKLPMLHPSTEYRVIKYVSQEQIPAMLEQARREAMEEAVKLQCEWCEEGLKDEGPYFNRPIWHYRETKDGREIVGSCTAESIRCKLAEQPKEE